MKPPCPMGAAPAADINPFNKAAGLLGGDRDGRTPGAPGLLELKLEPVFPCDMFTPCNAPGRLVGGVPERADIWDGYATDNKNLTL